MHEDHKDINNFKSFNEFFREDSIIDYKQIFKEHKDYFERAGYKLDGHDMKNMFLRECLRRFVQLGEVERVYDILDQLHILQYNEYLDKVKREFNKFDPSKKWLKRLKKVYFVQHRGTQDERSFIIYPHSNFMENFLDSDYREFPIGWSNLEEMIQKFDQNKHDIWLGQPTPMGDLKSIINPPLKFPILFFEKDDTEDFQFFNYYKVAWKSRWDDITFDEIGRSAASLLDTSLYKAFPELNIISATPYEGEECKGYMLIDEEIPDVELLEPVRLNEHKRIRKLLEVSDKNLILLVKPFTLIAYGFKVKTNYEMLTGIFIKFKNKLSWHCSMESIPLFQSDNFQIKLPVVDKKDSDSIDRAIRTVFKKTSQLITNKDITLLNKLVLTAQEQKKGTILVILEKEIAMAEATRLTQSSTLIKPKKLNIQLLKRLSGIDGAIILDTKGNCHAFGVILDGRITKGDPGRGARFNSAHRYFRTKEEKEVPCVLLIVSEDGHVSILPEEFEN
ncbi:DNA integrity scanning protein DisA nucleotide-binding domain protein (plasmid) [Priestia megaterium]|uniref:diadenylate cyclase n=1 Tax=Priestia megaterium TaxID=1404 RepID=UPI0020543BEB|nr:diadenylate cyclase [Priestia megaterium]UOO43817.1 DNA integrity scanning protein DisA nucleotide-binding domain protein [Priestia megaterium]